MSITYSFRLRGESARVRERPASAPGLSECYADALTEAAGPSPEGPDPRLAGCLATAHASVEGCARVCEIFRLLYVARPPLGLGLIRDGFLRVGGKRINPSAPRRRWALHSARNRGRQEFKNPYAYYQRFRWKKTTTSARPISENSRLMSLLSLRKE